MMMVIAILQSLGPYAWFIAGAVFLILETLLPGASLIWFGAAASLTGALLFVWPLGWEGQMIAFLLFSCVTVVFGRVIAARYASHGEDRVNRGAVAMIGRELRLAEPIVAGFGRAHWGDGLWRVSGPDRPAGSAVRVVGVEAATLLVEPVEETVKSGDEPRVAAPAPSPVDLRAAPSTDAGPSLRPSHGGHLDRAAEALHARRRPR